MSYEKTKMRMTQAENFELAGVMQVLSGLLRKFFWIQGFKTLNGPVNGISGNQRGFDIVVITKLFSN
jgi:hypothetical protein